VAARIRTHLSLVRVKLLDASYRECIYMLGAAGHYNDSEGAYLAHGGLCCGAGCSMRLGGA